MKHIFFTIFLIFLCSPAWAGVAHYADLSDAGSTNQGTFAEPFNTIALINAHAFATGDDLYFKAGTDETVATNLVIDWDGSSGDRAIIGAYDGDGDFDITGSARPILDGNSQAVPISQWAALVQYSGAGGYVTIQDLRVNNSGGLGIQIIRSSGASPATSSHNLIKNCYVYRSYDCGILLSRVCDSIIEDNTIEQAGYNLPQNTGGIYVMAMNTEGLADNNIVRGNTVFGCRSEGIGIGKKSRWTIVEYNTVYDNRNVNIYTGASKYTIFRYNLSYVSSSYAWASNGCYGLMIDNEAARNYLYTGGHKVYGNLIAACKHGISIACEYQRINGGSGQYANMIYNNTIVDCELYNLRIYTGGRGSWGNNEIKNNISYTLTAGSNHVSNDGADGLFTWNYNNYDDNDPGSPENTNAVIGAPTMSKTSGWRTLTAGAIDGTDFAILAGSNCDQAGTDVGGTPTNPYYNILNVDNGDFTASPITYETLSQNDHGWDIGGDVYQAAGENPPNMTLMCKFDTGVNWLRDEISDNDTYWTNHNATTSATHQQGSHSAVFENTAPGDWLSRAGTVNDFGMATNGAFTLCAWVRATDLTDDFRIFAKGASASNTAAYILKVKTDDSISGYIGWDNAGTANDWEEVPHGTAITVNQWYWVCWAHTVSTKANLFRIWSDTGDVLLGSDYTTTGTETMTGHVIAGDLGVGATSAGSNPGDLLVDKLVFYDRALTANEMDQVRTENWDSSTLTNSTAPAATYSTVGDTVTITITTSIEAWVENGTPYATLETGYVDAIAYYTGKTSTTQTYVATLVAGMRTTDLVWKDASITLPSGCTMQNAAGDDFTLTLPDAGAITNTTVIAVAGTTTDPITVGSGADIAKISDISHQLNNDVYQYLEPITDNVDITADSVLITGIGRAQVNTGTLTFSGDNNHVRCVNVSGAVTYENGEWEMGAYAYRP